MEEIRIDYDNDNYYDNIVASRIYDVAIGRNDVQDVVDIHKTDVRGMILRICIERKQ